MKPVIDRPPAVALSTARFPRWYRDGVRLVARRWSGSLSRRPGAALARLVAFAVLASLLAPSAAHAQDEEHPRLPWFVLDVHGSTVGFKTSADVATPLSLSATDLPGRGVGLELGAHVYPLRLRWLTLGLGGNLHVSRAHSAPAIDTTGKTVGHDVSARLTAVNPQLSFNFGTGRGWSYLSGGISTSRVDYLIDGAAADAEAPRRKTINYGGGARWFMKDHLAFSLDVRFYAINPVNLTSTQRQSPRMTLMVFSAGLSFK
jgi:hypothetical protein